MIMVNLKNERVKRLFFKWLKKAHGRCDSTVNSIEKAILRYEDFTGLADFATFNLEKAREFKKWLQKRKGKSKTLSTTTYCTYLRYLRTFFVWLSGQLGYKSKITIDTVDYLKPLEKKNELLRNISPEASLPWNM